jgi:hypothetical protein
MMTTATLERERGLQMSRGLEFLAYGAAAGLVAAAAWYALIFRHVTVAAPPTLQAGVPIEIVHHRYDAWFVPTLQQERIDTAIAIVAFVCLIPIASALRDRLGRVGWLTTIGATGVALGAFTWVMGNVVALGGHRAVGLMATHGNPIETVNAIGFTIDAVDDAFELVAFALIGAGILAFGWVGSQDRLTPVGWGWLSLAVGVVTLTLSGAYAAGDGNLVDLLLVIGGVVLLPAWLVWTGRLLRRAIPVQR